MPHANPASHRYLPQHCSRRNPEEPKNPQLTIPLNSLPNNNLPNYSTSLCPINAHKSTFYDSSQIPTQQHLPNSCTIRTAQNRPKRVLLYPHLGNPIPETTAPNLALPPQPQPQTVTPPPHPHIVPTASRPPLMRKPRTPPPPKNALLAINVTPSTITTYQQHPAIPAHHDPERQPPTPRQYT